MPVAPARHAGSRAHTLVSAHTFGVGVFRVFAWGRALLGLVVGVFARWVVGFGVCVWVVFVWVFALLGVGALVGWWDSVVPPPLATACLVGAHALACGLVGVCGVLRLPPACGGNGNGAGQRCPAPCSVACAVPPLRARGERKRVVGARPEW